MGRYGWIGEDGVPEQAKWTKKAGFGVSGLQSMRDEFPEHQPIEEVRLHCMSNKRTTFLHSVDLGTEEQDSEEPHDDLCCPGC